MDRRKLNRAIKETKAFKEQTPKPKKPKCICKELIKAKSIGWCPACKTDYI